MNIRHHFLHRTVLFSAALCAVLCCQHMHAQIEEVSRGLGSRGPVLTFESIGRGDTVFAATGSGQLFRSADTGRSWSLLRAVSEEQAICSLQESGGELLAGCRDGAVLASTDAGSTWTQQYRFSGNSAVTAFTSNAYGTLTISESGEIASRHHDTQQWDSIGTAPCIFCIDMMFAADSVLVVGSNGEGIVLSHDGGKTWRGPEACPLSGLITDLETCPCGGILASTSNLAMYHSSDAGNHWELFEDGSCSGPKGRLQDIAVTDDSLIFGAKSVSIGMWRGHGFQHGLNYNLITPPHSLYCLMDGHLLIGDSLGGIFRTFVKPYPEEATD